MASLPDGSVDVIIADPPYNIAVQGSNWDSVPDYLAWCTKWLQESKRLLRPGGQLFIYGSPQKLWICHLKLLAASLGHLDSLRELLDAARQLCGRVVLQDERPLPAALERVRPRPLVGEQDANLARRQAVAPVGACLAVPPRALGPRSLFGLPGFSPGPCSSSACNARRHGVFSSCLLYPPTLPSPFRFFFLSFPLFLFFSFLLHQVRLTAPWGYSKRVVLALIFAHHHFARQALRASTVCCCFSAPAPS